MQKFTEYTELPTQKLENAAKAVQLLSPEKVHELASIRFNDLFGEMDVKKLNINQYSFFSLRGVSDCGIRVDLLPEQFEGSDAEEVAGMTSIIHGKHPIPIIYISQDQNNTFEHECIHASQFLFNELYPLTKDDYALLLGPNNYDMIGSFDLINSRSSSKDTWNFIVRMVIWKFWIELEAVYMSQYEDYTQLIEKAYRSALPIVTLEDMRIRYSFPSSYMDEARSLIAKYLIELERDISWFNDLRKQQETSFYEDLLWAHEEWGMEQMFGPLEDDEQIEESDRDIELWG